MSEVERLQAWYRAQCDGDWEHSYGVTIDTLDNPGWHLKVDLVGTSLAEKPFPGVEHGINPDDADWVHCKVADKQFHGYGGASNLSELLRVFLAWADAERSVAQPVIAADAPEAARR